MKSFIYVVVVVVIVIKEVRKMSEMKNVKEIKIKNIEEFAAYYSPDVYRDARSRGESFEQILRERIGERTVKYLYEMLKRHGRLLEVPDWFVRKEPFWPVSQDHLYVIQKINRETEKAVNVDLIPVPKTPDKDEELVKIIDAMTGGEITLMKSMFTANAVSGWIPKSILTLILYDDDGEKETGK